MFCLRLRRRQEYLNGRDFHADRRAAAAKRAAATELAHAHSLAERGASNLGCLPMPRSQRDNTAMKLIHITKTGVIGVATAAVVAVFLVACGGGGGSGTSGAVSGVSGTPATTTTPVASAASSTSTTGVSVTWTPASIIQSVKPGASTTTTLTLVAKQATPSAVFAVVPAIAPYVSVSPASIGPLAAGQSVPVTLTIAAAAAITAPPLTVNGTVQLRTVDASGNTLAKPLPVQVNVLEVINGIVVPPEPDPTLNNATLAGVDSNNNGVRDDVERAIATKFGGTPIAAPMTAFAKAEQRVLITGLPSAIAESDSIFLCSKLNNQDTNQLTAILLNTAARKIAYKTIMSNAPAVGIREIQQACQN